MYAYAVFVDLGQLGLSGRHTSLCRFGVPIGRSHDLLYTAAPEIQNSLKLLREYLNRESAAQSTINRVFVLWASTKLSGLLNPEQQKAIVQEVLSRQQADGGWPLEVVSQILPAEIAKLGCGPG
jgi:hypothetical protein